jgi:DNA-binding YbaB/EbfC family protein
MFDMMKMMGKLGEVKTRMAEAQEAISKLEVTGESGAGMVKARMNGNRRLIGLEIDPSLCQPQEAEMLRDLLIAAVNNAATKMEDLSKEEMKKRTEGLLPNIPGMDLGAAFGI